MKLSSAPCCAQPLQALQNDHQVVLRVGACSDVSICAPLPPPPPPRLAAVSGGMPAASCTAALPRTDAS